MSKPKNSHIFQSAMFIILLLGCNATTQVVTSPAPINKPIAPANQASSEEKTVTSQKVKAQIPNDKKGSELPHAIAILPFHNLTDEPGASETLRTTLFGHLASSNYRFPHIKDIDNRLAILDPNQQLAPKEAGFLTNLLDVDGLLFVEILNYDKLYAGIYAQITFSVNVSLVNSKGEVLWQNQFEEISREGGVSMNALSILYNIAVTALHISDENLLAVADKLGRKIAAEFPQPQQYQQVTRSFIDTVLHDGVNKVLKYGDVLQVGIKGEANKLASVSIEGIEQIFPLAEKEPGIYLASITVDRRWNGNDLMLSGYLRDSSGVSSKYISSIGLINLDNIAPQPVQLIRQKNDVSQISIAWQHSESDLRYLVYNTSGEQHQILFETYQNEFVWQHQLGLFETAKLAVVAIDKAGNQSQELSISAPIYPLANMYEATIVKTARLPSQLKGQLLLLRKEGPFIIDQIVSQPPGASLFIEPGTEIAFTSAGKWLIQGSFFTFGQQVVKLKPLSEGLTAQTFLSLDSNEHVAINGMSIVGAGIAIEVLKGKPLIDNCSIINSQYSALVVANSAVVHMQNCMLQGSNTSALVVTDQARVRVTNSQFIDNFPFHIQSSSIYELEAEENRWQPDASAMTILGKVRY
jgi:hypothetical protein